MHEVSFDAGPAKHGRSKSWRFRHRNLQINSLMLLQIGKLLMGLLIRHRAIRMCLTYQLPKSFRRMARRWVRQICLRRSRVSIRGAGGFVVISLSACVCTMRLGSVISIHQRWGHCAGNCVPITPRILLMTVHGNDPGNGTLQWCTPPNIIDTRTTAAEQTNPPTYVDINGLGGGFRLRLLAAGQPDMPEDMICPLLNPSDAPNLIGAPVIAYNNYREATCWEIVTTESSGAYSLKRPTNASLSKVWRRFNNTSDPNTNTLDHENSASAPGDDAGSGTPMFLVFTNSAGQTQFVYFGHVTQGTALVLVRRILRITAASCLLLRH